MQFFLNPVAYIAAIDNIEIERIVFVLPSGDELSPSSQDAAPQPLDDGSWDLVFDEAGATDDNREADLAIFRQITAGRGMSVAFMRRGTNFRVAEDWEFVPYNDADVARQPTAAFRKMVADHRADLLAGPTDARRSAALVTLKALYDKQFGKCRVPRNVISLFLYAGPIRAGQQPRAQCLMHLRSGHRGFIGATAGQEGGEVGAAASFIRGTAILILGDASDRLVHFLGMSRIERLSCLQVMHHGAAGNWHPGVAQRLAPDVSIFSSDPRHKGFGHPHESVLRDFWAYGPVQVDGSFGATIKGDV